MQEVREVLRNSKMKMKWGEKVINENSNQTRHTIKIGTLDIDNH